MTTYTVSSRPEYRTRWLSNAMDIARLDALTALTHGVAVCVRDHDTHEIVATMGASGGVQ